jgi:mannitol/fructose-specific phosphotransferase system IIA component (Ntr-type)
MNPKRVLTKETVRCCLRSATKEEVIEELIDLLEASGQLKDRKSALKAVVDRERKMSTGLQNGIAIPHGKTDSVEHLVASLGIRREGVPFDSLDGQPARIVLLTISPSSRTGPHIQFLAEISRMLNDPAVRQRVLDAPTEDDVLDILSGEKAHEKAP